MTVEGALLSKGFSVRKAVSGKEGIEAAKEEQPDLIVLDLVMPDLNGFEVVDVLRAQEGTACVPVVILTGMSLSAAEKERLGGMAAHIVKKGDLTREGFIDVVENMLS